MFNNKIKQRKFILSQYNFGKRSSKLRISENRTPMKWRGKKQTHRRNLFLSNLFIRRSSFIIEFVYVSLWSEKCDLEGSYQFTFAKITIPEILLLHVSWIEASGGVSWGPFASNGVGGGNGNGNTSCSYNLCKKAIIWRKHLKYRNVFLIINQKRKLILYFIRTLYTLMPHVNRDAKTFNNHFV